MAGTAVQFWGVDQVVEAYEKYDAPTWGIFQQKSLFMRGMGSDELRGSLNMIRKSGSDAVYVLKVYDDIDDAKKIKEKSPDADGSFGFKVSGQGGGSSYNSMEERLKALEEGDREDDEPKGILGKIGDAALGLLSNPTELVQVIGAIKELFQQPSMQQAQVIGKVFNDFQRHDPPAVVVEKNNEVMSDEEKLQRLSKAIDMLDKCDPDALVHLEKLAKIAQDNPAMFKMLLINLDAYN